MGWCRCVLLTTRGRGRTPIRQGTPPPFHPLPGPPPGSRFVEAGCLLVLTTIRDARLCRTVRHCAVAVGNSGPTTPGNLTPRTSLGFEPPRGVLQLGSTVALKPRRQAVSRHWKGLSQAHKEGRREGEKLEGIDRQKQKVLLDL